MKILIIRLSSLGDIVLCQSICAWLRKQYPLAEIDFICKQQFVELTSLMGCGLTPIVYQKTLISHLALRRRRYDLVIDLHNKFSSFLVRLAAAAKSSSVYNKQRSKRKAIVAGDSKLAISSTVELYKSALDKLYLNVQLEAPRLELPQQELPFLLPQASKLVMLFPGAAHFTKMYPKDSYKQLLKISPSGFHYLLAGAPNEFELCNELQRSSPENSTNIAGLLSFSQILVAIKASDCVISSDSGPMHLVAALEKPQIAIFGATHPRLGFAPQNPHAHILCANLDCQPCSLHGAESCPRGHFQCMLSINPQSLLNIMQSSC